MKRLVLLVTTAVLLPVWIILAVFLLQSHDSWIVYAFILTTVLIGITGVFMHHYSRVATDLRYIGKLSRNILHNGNNANNLLPTNDQPEEIRPFLETLRRWSALEEDRLAQEHAFTSEASHELRSPLTGIRLQAQIAQRAKDPLQREQALNHVIRSIDRSTHLIEQLLSLSRLTRRYSQALLEKTELISLAASITEGYSEQAQKKGITLEYVTKEDKLWVYSKDELIATLLENLLKNALHHTPAKGQIKVVTNRASNTNAELTVEDSGPGVPSDQYQVVQSPFQKASDGRKKGTGLGLSIVKRIAELHDSDIHLARSTLGGLAVTTALPLIKDSNDT